jgi:uncharacterized membrane protein
MVYLLSPILIIILQEKFTLFLFNPKNKTKQKSKKRKRKRNDSISEIKRRRKE